jgi:hypothetical protein
VSGLDFSTRLLQRLDYFFLLLLVEYLISETLALTWYFDKMMHRATCALVLKKKEEKNG